MTRLRHSRPGHVRPGPIRRGLCLALAALVVLAPVPGFAGTSIGGVEKVQGDVRVKSSRRGINVYQRSAQAEVEFSALPDNLYIRQPGADSLISVSANSERGTRFSGEIEANGILILSDERGFRVERGASIRAAELSIVGGRVSLQNGIPHFEITSNVENHGELWGNTVALMGRHVANAGRIHGREAILMLAGDDFSIRNIDSPIVIHLNAASESNAASAAAQDSVGAGDALAYAIHHTGSATADHIALDAGANGAVKVEGELDASDRGESADSDGIGGSIDVLGGLVGLFGARLDASGRNGGGSIRVGGDLQGGGDVVNSQNTIVDENSEVLADALAQGDGGRIIVWADGDTVSRGRISARGGELGGNGGFAEVSGKRRLEIDWMPDLRAPLGKGGTLLLDPNDVFIVEDAALVAPTDDQNLDSAFDRIAELASLGENTTIQPNTDESYITAGSIAEQLRAGIDIVITTETPEIFADRPSDDEGNIEVQAPIEILEGDTVQSLTSATLELRAANDLIVDAEISNENENLFLNVTLIANDGNAGEDLPETPDDPDAPINNGDLRINANIHTGGGDLALTGWNVEVGDEGGNPVELTTDFGDVYINEDLFSGIVFRLPDGTLEHPQGGNVTLHSGSKILTDGGNVSIAHRTLSSALFPDDDGIPDGIRLEGEIDTSPYEADGTTRLLTSVGGEVRVRSRGGSVLVDEGLIRTFGGDIRMAAQRVQFEKEDGEEEYRGGILRLGTDADAILFSETGDVLLGGYATEINSPIDTSFIDGGADPPVNFRGGDVVIDDDDTVGFPDDDSGLERKIVVNAPITTNGGDVYVGLDPEALAEGIRDVAGSFELNADIDTFDSETNDDPVHGTLNVDLLYDFLAQNGANIRAETVSINAGLAGYVDPALEVNHDLNVNLEFAADTSIHSDDIVLAAGDGFTAPVPESSDSGGPGQVGPDLLFPRNGIKDDWGPNFPDDAIPGSEPDDPRNTAQVILPTPSSPTDPNFEVRRFDGGSLPESFALIQDASIFDNASDGFDVPIPEVFTGSPGADLDGMAYSLISQDGTLQLSDAAKVEQSRLQLGAAGDLLDPDEPVTPFDIPALGNRVDRLVLTTQAALQVDAGLAADITDVQSLQIITGNSSQFAEGDPASGITQLAVPGDLIIGDGTTAMQLVANGDSDGSVEGEPEDGMLLWAGRAGYGDLVLEDAVTLAARRISLLAGDQLSTSDFVDASIAVAQSQGSSSNTGTQFRSETGLDFVGEFVLRQDASISDANLPDPCQFVSSGTCNAAAAFATPFRYEIVSNDGSVTLADAERVRNTELDIAALSGITFEEEVEVQSIELGGLHDFEVPIELVDKVSFIGPESRFVLRAGESSDPNSRAGYTLSFESDSDDERGVRVRADEIWLQLGTGAPTNIDRGDRIDLESEIAPLFLSRDGTSAPATFGMRSSGVFRDDGQTQVTGVDGTRSLPSLFHFGGTPVDDFILRSDHIDTSSTAETVEITITDLEGLESLASNRTLLSAQTISFENGADGSSLELTDDGFELRADRIGFSAIYDPDAVALGEGGGSVGGAGGVLGGVSLPDDDPSNSTASVDFSQLEAITGFDSGLDEDGIPDSDFVFDYETPTVADPDDTPELYSVTQDADFHFSDDMAQAEFNDTVVDVVTRYGSLDLASQEPGNDTATDILMGSRLGLTVESLDEGVSFPSNLFLTNLTVDTVDGLTIADTTIEATEGIIIWAGSAGVDYTDESSVDDEAANAADLDFAGNVTLRSNAILLRAGNGFDPNQYVREPIKDWRDFGPDDGFRPDFGNSPTEPVMIEVQTSVNARDDLDAGKTVNFEFIVPDPDDDESELAAPLFQIIQDASLVFDASGGSALPGDTTLPVASQLSFVKEDPGNPDLDPATTQLGLYVVEASEGTVTRETVANTRTSSASIEVFNYEQTGDASTERLPTESLRLGLPAATTTADGGVSVSIVNDGDLDFRYDDGIVDPDALRGVVITADRVLLESLNGSVYADGVIEDPDPDVDADLDLGVLQIEGRSNFAPAAFTLRQTEDLTADNLPARSQLTGSLSGLKYAVVARGADLYADEGNTSRTDFGDKVLGSELLLAAEANGSSGGDIEISSDLDVNSLIAVGDAANDGEIRISAETITTTNVPLTELALAAAQTDQRYLSPVVFDGADPTQITARGLEFADTVDGIAGPGGGAVEIQTAQNVAFRRDVGGSEALESLDVTAGMLRDFNGDLWTLSFGGESEAVSFLGEDLEAISTLFPDGEFAFGPVAGAVEVRTEQDLSLNLGWRSEAVDDEERFSRPFVPEVASITMATGDLALVSESGSVRAGDSEKITATGELRIEAADTARFADLTGLDVSVTAPEIEISRRHAGRTEQNSGDSVKDGGVDIVGNSVEFTGNVTSDGPGRRPVFVIQDVRAAPDWMLDDEGRGRFTITSINPEATALAVPALLAADGRVLDGLGTGASRADLSGTLPDIEQPPPQPGALVIPTVARVDELGAVGVAARPLRAREYRGRLEGATIIDDVTVDSLRATRDRVVVADARLRSEEAELAVALYEEIFGPQRERAPEIRATLERVVEDYVATTGIRRIVGFELRRFVRNRPNSQFEAFELLENLDALFRYHRRLGLAPGEFRRIQEDWLRDVTPEGITRDELLEAIHPSRYVRGSDILDIFGN